MRVLFCSDPTVPGRPDRARVHEVEAAEAAGVRWSQIDVTALAIGDVGRALRRVEELASPEVVIYRGRRLRASTYEALHAGLLARRWRLIDEPAAYRSTHLLRHALPLLGADGPRTVIVPLGPEFGWPAIHAALAGFAGRAVSVGDCSRASEPGNEEPCLLAAADDRAEVERVVGNYIERQADELVGGLVFRAYEPLMQLGAHPDSGLPVPRRWRRFVADGRVLAESPVWLADPGPAPPALDSLMRRVPARLFTIDVAERAAGGWMALELDAGQVADAPPQLDVRQFYRALAAWDPRAERRGRAMSRREVDREVDREVERSGGA